MKGDGMTRTMNPIERAILILLHAHRGQVDKAGEPYVLHPLRVMQRVKSQEARLVALLHDVLEESDVSLDSLRREGFPEAVLQAVECLTRRKGEAYPAYIERVRKNPLAVEVKVADLEDNLVVTRLPSMGEKDLARVKRYHNALRMLLKD